MLILHLFMFIKNLMSVKSINIFLTGCFVFKMIYNMLPSHLSSFFFSNKSIHHHSTSLSNDLHAIFAHRTCVRSTRVRSHGVKG